MREKVPRGVLYVLGIILFFFCSIELLDLGIIRNYSSRGWLIHIPGITLKDNSIFNKICTSKNGVFAKSIYSEDTYICEIPFSDSGMSCTEASQCKGTCTIDYIPDDCELDLSSLGNFHPDPADYSLWKCMEIPKGECTSGMDSVSDYPNYILIEDGQIERSRLSE